MALHNSGIGVWRHDNSPWRARCHVSIRQSPSLCNAILNTCPCLLPIQYHLIIWTNDDVLSIRCKGTIFSEIMMESATFSFKKMNWNMSSAKWQPLFLGLKVLSPVTITQLKMGHPPMTQIIENGANSVTRRSNFKLVQNTRNTVYVKEYEFPHMCLLLFYDVAL